MDGELIGYHGTSKRNEQNILKEGFIESVANSDHWLGRGVYFFDNIYYAIEWGIMFFMDKRYNKYNNYIKHCAIIQSSLDIQEFNLLDLNDPVGYTYYLKFLNIIKEKFPDKIGCIEQDGDIQIIRLLEEIEELTGEHYISLFDIITADYPKDIYQRRNKKLPGDFLPCIQKQICVKNQNAIKQIVALDLNQNIIKSYFDLIIKNRKENLYEKRHKNFRNSAKKVTANSR